MNRKNKKSEESKPGTRKRRQLTDEQKAAIKKYFDEHPITYTVECVGEYIHPDVKARLEAAKKNSGLPPEAGSDQSLPQSTSI